MNRYWPALGMSLLALSAANPVGAAEPWPTKPVRILVNTGTGGLVDVTTRLIAQQMSEQLRQQVVVDNRAGGDGLIGIRAAKAAPSDGYTLLASANTLALQLVAKDDAGYELKDFTAIGVMGRSPYLVVEAASQPDKTLADFIARARARPGKLSYASAGVGTASHVAAAMLINKAGLDVLHVPYKGNGPAIPDVLSGRVNMIFEAYGSSGAKIRAGQMKALAVTSTARLASLPDVPTIAESVPGYSYSIYLYLVAPAGTPKHVVDLLADALRKATATRPIAERFRTDGIEVVDMSPEQTDKDIAREAAEAASLMSGLGLAKQPAGR